MAVRRRALTKVCLQADSCLPCEGLFTCAVQESPAASYNPPVTTEKSSRKVGVGEVEHLGNVATCLQPAVSASVPRLTVRVSMILRPHWAVGARPPAGPVSGPTLERHLRVEPGRRGLSSNARLREFDPGLR